MTEIREGTVKETQMNPCPTGHMLWQAAIPLSALVIVFTIFRETAWSMVTTWKAYSYSHGFLILPLSLYLIYAARKRISSIEMIANPWGLLLLGGLGCTWFLGDIAGTQFVKQASLVGMIPAFVWLTLGTQVTRAMLFPLLCLFFAVPLGEGLIPQLQDITAFLAVKGLDLMGIPVLLEGRIILIPSGAWEVAEVCAGLRFLTASTVLGCLYAYLVYVRWTRRLAFVAACLLLPILANAVRVFGIILLGHLTHNRLAAGVDHIVYGWIFSTLVILALFAGGWPWREQRAISARGAGGEPQLQEAERPRISDARTSSASPARSTLRWAAAGIALVASAPLALWLTDSPPNEGPAEISPPPLLPPWRVSEGDTNTWTPRFSQATQALKQTYMSSSEGRRVYFYVAYYSAGDGSKLVSSSNTLAAGRTWTYADERTRIATLDGERASVHETALRSREANLLVWSWYWVDKTFTDNPYRAKLLRVRARLFGGPQESALVAVSVIYGQDRSEAANTLQDFLRDVYLHEWLERLSR